MSKESLEKKKEERLRRQSRTLVKGRERVLGPNHPETEEALVATGMVTRRIRNQREEQK